MEEKGREEEKVRKEDKGMGGYFISKKSLWLTAGGALGALAAIGIGKASKKIRPAVVGAAKEGYAVKEWVMEKVERVKEDVEDIVAEAKYAHYKDIEASTEAVKREKEILEKAEKAVEKKVSREKEKKDQFPAFLKARVQVQKKVSREKEKKGGK